MAHNRQPPGCSSLYLSAVNAFALQFSSCTDENISSLPNHVLLDVISSLHASGRQDLLQRELSSLEVFKRLHACPEGRSRLHHCFQQLGAQKKLAAVALTDGFMGCTPAVGDTVKPLISERKDFVQLGLALGAFLTDVGYLPQARMVYNGCLSLLTVCPDDPQCQASLFIVDCYTRLLRTLTLDRAFAPAESILSEANQRMEHLESSVNMAGFYTAAAELFFVRNDYGQAFDYSRKALRALDCSVSIKVILDTLRRCSVTSVMKRDFPTAAVFAKQALRLAKHIVGEDHPCYADVLLDYAFYLLNADFTEQAVLVYKEATKKIEQLYGTTSFRVAFCYEDLAYALYLQEYSSGEFSKSFELVETALRIYSDILSQEHPISATAKRIKALILEEMALDHEDVEAASQLLNQAWHLHTDALQLAVAAFGEDNVQTAKHYGNLGRLYQSFGQFDKAVELHLKAIEIKERALGKEDYEVALSVGHLASLYNYDMELYDEAEKLYLRSVALGLKLFGPTYSGLEYDYRGLVWLYTAKNDSTKANHYEALLDEWDDMRMQKQNADDVDPLRFLSLDEDSFGSRLSPVGQTVEATASPSSAHRDQQQQQCPRLSAATTKVPHSCCLPLCCTILPLLRPKDAS